MWTSSSRAIPNSRGIRYEINLDDVRLTSEDVLKGWQSDSSFRSFFNTLLASSTFSAFRWETPAWDTLSLSKPFEFVLFDSPDLARKTDRSAFAEHFDGGSEIAVFSNLGGDSSLVVPCPVAEDSAYGHLAAFVRLAPENQRDALWQTVGNALRKRIGTKPVWLSTAGVGVSWLHVRLDDRPKYYGHRAYALGTV
jgi:hypothetical protein